MRMLKTADLPDVVPVFPLAGALLLPRAHLPLHIFEPRYLAMLEDALKTPQRLIAMAQPLPRRGNEDTPALHAIASAGRVTQFSETEDGRYMVTLTGVSRCRVLREVDGFTPYRRAEVSWEGFERDMGPAEKDAGFNREAFFTLLGRYFEARDLSTDWEALKSAEDELLVNSLSMMLEFDAEEKQALLEAPTLPTRRETLVALLEYGMRGGDGEELMQ